MIQRKQSLHLLAIVALMVAMLFMPLATLTVGGSGTANEKIETATDGTITKTTIVSDSSVELNIWGLYADGVQVTPLVLFTIITFMTIAVAFVNIFLYRKRMLQLRLCFVLAILLIGILAYTGLYIYELHGVKDTQEFAAIKYSVVDLFPLVALVLTWFAYRGITTDIALLRSLDRIR